MNPFSNKDQKSNNKGKKKPSSSRNPLWRNVLTSIAIFLLLIVVYSAIVENNNKPQTIPISQLATDVTAGKVTKISVKNDELTVTYANGDTRAQGAVSTHARPNRIQPFARARKLRQR